ncbi:MAG: hypothetical protein ACI3XL_06360 [Eubacteriales bacterium]
MIVCKYRLRVLWGIIEIEKPNITTVSVATRQALTRDNGAVCAK